MHDDDDGDGAAGRQARRHDPAHVHPRHRRRGRQHDGRGDAAWCRSPAPRCSARRPRRPTAGAVGARPRPSAASRRWGRAPRTASRCRRGFRADVLISWGDTFLGAGETLEFGFNNDFLAYFPLAGRDEGILFVNHEYPDPFFQHGFKASTRCGQVAGAGADRAGRRRQLVPARQARRQRHLGGRARLALQPPHLRRPPGLRLHRPARGDTARRTSARPPTAPSATAPAASRRGAPRSPARRTTTATARPRPTRLRATAGPSTATQHRRTPSTTSRPTRSTAGSSSTTPTTRTPAPRKHTALGRFRHENTAFRHVPGKKFVLYMGDDKANEGLYKFVSDRQFKPGPKARTTSGSSRTARSTSPASSPRAAAASRTAAT